jgi:hypothetical protein
VIREARIQQQLQVLNAGFGGSGLNFELEGINYTTNSNWFNFAMNESNVEYDMKSSLRRGGYGTMNVYTVNAEYSPFAGFGTFPITYWYAPKLDGIMLSYSRLPGGPDPFAVGKTMVHEAGHWCGLYHTFGLGNPTDLSTVK